MVFQVQHEEHVQQSAEDEHEVEGETVGERSVVAGVHVVKEDNQFVGSLLHTEIPV